jgi:hypothetical protein
MTVVYDAIKRKPPSREYTHSAFVESLIMPRQEFEIETLDPSAPSLLTPHSTGMANEWLPIPKFQSAERIDASP